jgi:hypothetical protein
MPAGVDVPTQNVIPPLKKTIKPTFFGLPYLVAVSQKWLL